MPKTDDYLMAAIVKAIQFYTYSTSAEGQRTHEQGIFDAFVLGATFGLTRGERAREVLEFISPDYGANAERALKAWWDNMVEDTADKFRRAGQMVDGAAPIIAVREVRKGTFDANDWASRYDGKGF
jgi:hypothetical protein